MYKDKMSFYRIYQTPEISWSKITETATPFNPRMLTTEEYVRSDRDALLR